MTVARRKRNSQPSVSLFPFLSILACVIGTLTLMITALALGQMDNDAVGSPEELQRYLNQAAEDRKENEKLEIQIAEDEAKAKATDEKLERILAETRTRFRQVTADVNRLLEEKKDPSPPPKIPVVDEEKQAKELAALEKELAAILAKKKPLLDQIAQRKKPPEKAKVRIQPGGSGVNLNPTFVECTASSAVIYEGKTPKRIRRADLRSDETYLALLNRIAEAPKDTVIFLVRDDGLGTFYTARAVARSKYARNGKLPVPGQGKLDLSVFER